MIQDNLAPSDQWSRWLESFVKDIKDVGSGKILGRCPNPDQRLRPVPAATSGGERVHQLKALAMATAALCLAASPAAPGRLLPGIAGACSWPRGDSRSIDADRRAQTPRRQRP